MPVDSLAEREFTQAMARLKVQLPLENYFALHICRYSPIEMETDYKVATFSYLSNGGDGLTILKEKATSRLQGPLDTDVFVNYIKRITPITLGVENRYTVLRSGQHLQMTSGAAQVASISSRITLLLTLLLCGLANQMHK